MAAAQDAGQSGDAYIGSFISLVSKAEIRYEGFLYHINPQESTIGLRNVKSYGTEGRRKDGPQILPSDKVYDYIFFRGSDIKDLQVLSSPAVRSAPALPNDPAIIKSHYPICTPTSSSLPAVNAVPETNTGGNTRSESSSSNNGGNWPQNQPAGISGSWGSFPLPPIANGNGIALPTYWPGLNGPSLGASHLHSQSLLGSPECLPVPPPVLQMAPNSTTNASLPVNASNFHESSYNSFATHGLQSQSLSSTMAPQSAPLSSVSIWHSAMLPALSPTLVSNGTSNSLPAKTFGPNSLLVPPLVASSLDTSPVVPPVMDKCNSVYHPPLSKPTISEPNEPINQSSGSIQTQIPAPSLVTPGQLLQTGPAGHSLPYLQTSHKDVHIDADQLSKLKPLSSDSVRADDTALGLPPLPVKKKKGTAQPNNPNARVHTKGKPNLLHGAASRNHQNYKGHSRARKLEQNRAVLQPNQATKVNHQGSKIGPNTADGYNYSNVRGHGRWKRPQPNTAGGYNHSNVRGPGQWKRVQPNIADRSTHCNVRGHGQRIKAQPKTGDVHNYLNANTASGRTHQNANAASRRTQYNVWGPGKGKGAQVSPAVTSFTNDFDFEAMNEKFNKEKIWGDLGKSNRTRLDKDRGDANDTGKEKEYELPRFNQKPIYVKDEFFDSLSCQSVGYKSQRERAKLSEQRKVDVETFGEIPKHGPSHSSREPGWGGQSRRRRRGYGYVGRGHGQDEDGGDRVT